MEAALGTLEGLEFCCHNRQDILLSRRSYDNVSPCHKCKQSGEPGGSNLRFLGLCDKGSERGLGAITFDIRPFPCNRWLECSTIGICRLALTSCRCLVYARIYFITPRTTCLVRK